MDCKFKKKARRKHTNMARHFTERPSWVVLPKIRAPPRMPPLLLPVMIIAMMELSIIAVEARSVDAIMLLRRLCTASTPYLVGS